MVSLVLGNEVDGTGEGLHLPLLWTGLCEWTVDGEGRVGVVRMHDLKDTLDRSDTGR